MARIIVLGGTGYAGGHIVAEAAGRGHEVVAVSRTAPKSLPTGATHRAADLRDPALLGELVDGSDVVIATVSPRGDLSEPGALRGIYTALRGVAAQKGVRLGVIGGAGSLQVAEGGPKLIDTPEFPEPFTVEARELDAVLEDLRGEDEQLDWFLVSPAATFNATNPGEATGTYRVGDDVLLADEDGNSELSGADLGLAIVDEIEKPAHRRTRFTVAY